MLKKEILLLITLLFLLVVSIFILLGIIRTDNWNNLTSPTPSLKKIVSTFKVVDINIGSGREVVTGDVVDIRSTIVLENGSPFPKFKLFNSFKIGENKMLRGVDMGILGMKVGGKRKITLSPDLAYGNLGPNSNLVFSIDLIGIK